MGKNVTYVSQKQKEYCFNTFGGQTPSEYRPVIRVRLKDAWYKKGQIIKVETYGTCGAWYYRGRWVDYWDVGLPLKYYPWYKRLYFFFTNLFC